MHPGMSSIAITTYLKTLVARAEKTYVGVLKCAFDKPHTFLLQQNLHKMI